MSGFGETPPRAAVVTARCVADKSMFGLRTEERSRGLWFVTWAFAIPEHRAAREGYTANQLSGSFDLDPRYPGCPACGNGSFAQCGSCNKLGCYSGDPSWWTCPHCGRGSKIGGSITSMSSNAD